MNKINYFIKKILPVLTISVFFLCSCIDLDVESVSTITNASMWKSEDDVNGGVNGMYVQFRNAIADNYYYASELRSEIMNGGAGIETPYMFYYTNSLNPSSPLFTWQSFYTVVNAANLVIKNAPDISFTLESSKNKVLAQAHAMRAFMYFMMTRTWGDLIIHTDPVESTGADVIYRERSPQADVFRLIKDDIDKAIQLFPDNSFPSGRCFWSIPATYALKADVYLWTGKRMNGGDADINVALQALQEVARADVDLLPEFGDIFQYDNKGNKEIVMVCRYQDVESGNNYGWRMWIHPGYYDPNELDEEAIELLTREPGRGYFMLTDHFRNQFEPGDTRKKVTFYELNNINAVGNLNSVCLKMSGFVRGGIRYFVNDIILYRYADILLLIAEAKNALGQDPSAEINLVRERAYQENYASHIYTNDTREKNDEAILQERLLELATEGGRWWDLIRFDKAFDLVPSLQDKKGQNHYLLFPITTDVLSLEHNVRQNPGWD